MPTRTEVETLQAKISALREVLDVAVQEIIMLQTESNHLKESNWKLLGKLRRRWNGRVHPFQCPVCKRWVRLLEAELDMNDQILYVVGECKQHGRVTPTGRWTIDDIKGALPRGV